MVDSVKGSPTLWKRVLEWRPTLPQHQLCHHTTFDAVILSDDSNHDYVLTRCISSLQQISVSIPYSDRVNHFSDIIRDSSNDVIRVVVIVRGSMTQLYACEVDVLRLEHHMCTSGVIPQHVAVVNMLIEQLKVSRHCRNLKASPCPSQQDASPNCPPHLFETQMQSLMWMKSVEQRVETCANILSYDNVLEFGQCSWKLDISYRWFVDKDARTSQNRLCYNGALLSDVIGSGKTATFLQMVTDTPGPHIDDPFECHTTLVIIPSHLSLHWKNEALKFARRLKVLCVTERMPAECSTLEAMRTYDVIITTLQFLKGSRYCSLISDMMAQLDLVYSQTCFQACMTCARARKLTPSDLPPVFEMLKFRRVVYDESHEVVKVRGAIDRLRMLRSTIRWGITATPEITYDQARLIVVNDDVLLDCGALKCIEDNLVRMTTFKHDVEIRHVVHYVALSAYEHIMLQTFPETSVEEVMQICLACVACETYTNSLAATVLYVNDTLVTSTSAVHERLQLAERQLVAMSKTLDEERERLKICLNLDVGTEKNARVSAIRQSMRTLTRRVSTFGAEVDRLRTKLNTQQRCYSYLQQRLGAADECDMCPICYSSPATHITECGHLFCRDCLNVCYDLYARCALCRTSLTRTGTRVERDSVESSKMTKIMQFVREEHARGERVIVFSQYKRSLRILRVGLSDMNHVYALHGVPTMKEKAIAKFCGNEGSILLLTWDENCAGLSLECCKVVVLMHPYCTDESSIHEREQQAIGRVVRIGCSGTVMVHHFVADCAAEKKLWSRTHSDSSCISL